MEENKENITWQPISFLSQIADMIDGMLDAAKETYEPLWQIKVHDDYTIKRIFEVTGQQIEDEWMYEETAGEVVTFPRSGNSATR